ncbi:MAG: GNAT family N-acetyltransferase [Candidatus Omnitrophica bacterium]|nr:GNAT family N-acetyltransferase [Candidatus Omnitrophota bacterium]
MGHILREFKSDDASGVKELILGILTREYPFDRSVYADSDLDKIRETYGGPKDAFFVVDEDGGIAGTVGVKMETDDDALLRRLFVNVKRRRRGYGSALIEKAVEFCRTKGYKKMIFRCTDRMSDAMKLCAKKGFKETDKLLVGGFNIHKLELEIK